MTGEIRLLRTAEMAELLGVPLSSLYRHLHALQRDHGFPQPVPGLPGRRYDLVAIRRWLDRQAEPAGPAAPRPPANDPLPPSDDLAAWNAELDRRFAELAAGTRP